MQGLLLKSQRMLRDLCRERDVPYNEHPTFLGAIGSHFRVLKKLGREENCLNCKIEL